MTQSDWGLLQQLLMSENLDKEDEQLVISNVEGLRHLEKCNSKDDIITQEAYLSKIETGPKLRNAQRPR